MVVNDFTFAHPVITFDTLNPNIFPLGSTEIEWVNDATKKLRTI